jgi:uncharacterized membrane protein
MPKQKPASPMESSSAATRKLEYGARQLRRLEFLTDVVYGLVILRLFTLLPKPDDASIHSVGELFQGSWISLAFIVIGMTFTIVYWIQNNAVFGALERTNNRHTTFSILQIFALLLFLYSVKLGIRFDGDILFMIGKLNQWSRIGNDCQSAF